MGINSNAWNRTIYTAWAPVYDVMIRPFDAMRQHAIAHAHIQPGERILIVGAGTGQDLPYLPQNSPITALDITPAMLRRLQRRAARHHLHVTTLLADGMALPFPAATFDVVLLHLIVAVIPDPVACLREAARVLAPAGRISILDKFLPDNARPPLAMRLARPFIRLMGTDTTRQLGPLLAQANLQIEKETPGLAKGYYKSALVRPNQTNQSPATARRTGPQS